MGSILSSLTSNAEGGAAEAPKPLLVEYYALELPAAMIFMSKYIPSFILRKLLVSGSAPKPPKDCIDLLPSSGEGMQNNDNDDQGGDPTPESSQPKTTTTTATLVLTDPYEMMELVPNQLWRIRYSYVPDDTNATTLKMFGVDFLDPTLKDRADDEAIQEMILQSQKCCQLHEAMTPVEKCQNGYILHQDMIVVRLTQEKLLLYNVCRVHPQLLEWLQSLGTVEWIISASSLHTNMIPLAAEQFPMAKLVLTSAANEKCMYVGCRPADYLYDTPEGFQSIQDLLSPHNILIHHIKGDVMTQSLFVRAHNHLLECDMLYDRFGVSDEEQWRTKCDPTKKHHMCNAHLYYYSAIGKPTSTSPNGSLPSFRIMAMDPTTPFVHFLLDPPKPDGSSCTEMAQSLRALLQLDGYDNVCSVHSYGDKPMPKEEFRNLIDKSWDWLDGKSLLSSS